MAIESTGQRDTVKSRVSNATRNLVVFEVLDYDSRTYVPVSEANAHVVGMIYKKVTISHTQKREFSLAYSTPSALDKNGVFNDVDYLDPAPASDDYEYSGTRKVEYYRCLVVGSAVTKELLGSVDVGVSGYYNMSGTHKDLIEGDATEDISGPTFTVTGNRLYGVSVNIGAEAMTYSYDVEGFSGTSGTMGHIDSPVNIEDYNEYWTKTHRVVGAMGYSGTAGTRSFPYAGGILPDTVMAVGYGTI